MDAAPPKDTYDVIIAGGGLAGLSLACHLVRSGLRDRSILIIDKDARKQNDRTWGYWSREPLFFDEIVCRTWHKLRVAGADFTRTLDLGDYRYQVIRGLDFYRHARAMLAAHDTVQFQTGRVREITDHRDAACVTLADGARVWGTWVFDSLPPRPPDPEDVQRFRHLKMHFRGWEVATPRPAFDPETLTFLDFRTPQAGEMRFFYVLPFAEDRALVEFTVFSQRVLRRFQYEAALRAYLDEALEIEAYTVLGEERGCVPITDQPYPRQLGRHVMAIGARAGRIKPSTGYAFVRVQEDCDEIVASLLLYGHPFEVPEDPDLYDVLDAVMLQVMQRHGGHVQAAFSAMFRRNPADHILHFLDEEASAWENLLLVMSMPPPIFMQALLQVVAKGSLREVMEA